VKNEINKNYFKKYSLFDNLSANASTVKVGFVFETDGKTDELRINKFEMLCTCKFELQTDVN